MRTLLLLLSTSVVLMACQPSPTEKPAAAAPPVFEVRDFKFDQTSEGGIVLIRGRGTLVTRDPRLLSGIFMVWVSVKKEHRNDREQRYAVVLRDGVGNIETSDRLEEFAALTVTTQFKDWKIIGFTQLEPATLAVPSQPASSPKQ